MRPSRLVVLSLAALTACGESNSPIIQALQDYYLTYCANAPLFVAIQAQNGGAWTPVTLDGTASATVQLGEKFGLATVRQNSATSYSTYITYITKSELPSATAASCGTLTGNKTINGSISTLSAGQEAQVSMGGKSAYLFAGGATTFQFTGMRDGAKDVIAQRRISSTGAEDKVIVVRGQDLTTGGTLAQLNFGGASAATPASGAITITGLSASESGSLYGTFYTANNGYAFFNSPVASNTAGTVFGPPAAQTVSTDVFGVSLYVNGTNTSRGVDLFTHTFGVATMAAGPALSTPTVTSVNANPKRLRIQLPSQAEYGKAVEFYYYQSAVGTYRSMDILISSGYLGSTPTTWDIQPPDLTGVSGYPAAAEFGSATAYWDVNVFSSLEAYFKPTVNVADNTVVKWAYLSSSTAVTPPEAGLRAAEPMRGPTRRALLGLTLR